MINLIDITEEDVRVKLRSYLKDTSVGSEQWRILASALRLSDYFSFTENRTYPRPDHPDERKRKPLIYMLVAILISLRTTLENEQKAVGNLISKFPDAEDLFSADVKDIEDCIQPAGMANKKSITIRKALDYVEEKFNGSLEALSLLDTEDARSEILKIPGVGPKSADCLLSIGLGKPSIAVDVNVFRVTSWLFAFLWSDNPNYNDEKQIIVVKRFLDNFVPKDAFLCQIVHTYFLLFGKSIGSKHPKNEPCLIHEYCMMCQKNNNFQLKLFK